MGAGGYMQAAGAVVSAGDELERGGEQKRLHDFNAENLRFAARDAIERGHDNVNRQREFAAGVTGAQRAGYAGQGVSLDTGSALEAQEDTARISALDEATILNNARKEAWGFLTAAASEKYQGRVARREGGRKAVGSLLGGAGGAASNMGGKGGKGGGGGSIG